MENLLTYCGGIISANDGIFISLITAGFLGSLTHCSSMCGPIIAGQMLAPESQLTGGSHSSRTTAMLGWYHAGRITTYILLGMIAAMGGALIWSGGEFTVISGIFLLLAGIVFITSAIAPRRTHACGCGNSFLYAKLQALRLALPLQFYLRGVLLGFMPCGLVMAALLLVATTHSLITASLGMLFFGITTIPILQIIGYGVNSVARTTLLKKISPAMSLIGRGAMTVNGLMLCVLGINVM